MQAAHWRQALQTYGANPPAELDAQIASFLRGHESEPGCAVKEALASGRLAPERWESYLKLQSELDALERRLDKRAASESRQQWRSLSKAQRAYYKEHGKDR